MFSHERLEVYRASVAFLAEVLVVLQALPKGSHDVAAQLRRAAMLISLNIAEGAGKTGPADKRRYYSIARGSALESAALFDVMLTWELSEPEPLPQAATGELYPTNRLKIFAASDFRVERTAAMLGALTTRS